MYGRMCYFGIRKLRGARAVIALAALLGLAAVPSVAQASTAELGPASLDFPNTLVGVSSPDQQVFFTNDGPDSIDVSAVSIGGIDQSDFAVTVDNCTGVTVAAGESCELRVGFAPTARGDRSAELDVTHTGDGGLASAPLSGKGVTQELTIRPSQLDFPATTVNYPGGQQQLQVQNTGDLPVSINNVFIDGSEGADFNQNNNCGGQLTSDQVCFVNVAFWPHGEGTRNATLHVNSDAARKDETAPLTGTGVPPQLSFEPGSYDFGLQQINNNSAQTNFLLRNTGAAPVQVNSIDIVAPGPNAFWTGNIDCWGQTLQPNDTCNVQVNFGPNQPIPYSAQLRAMVNGVSFTAFLSGRGGQPVFTASPNPADFGFATAGQPGDTRTITLINQGDLPGAFFVAIISGGDVGSFRLLHEDCTGVPLGPSASCTAQVRFQPESSGAKVATLTLVGDQGQPFQMNLTGDGVDPQVSLTPDDYDFGRQAVGSSSAGQRFELSNDGASPMRLSGASIIGPDADQFRLSADDCTDVTLPTGGRCAVQVRFAPDAKGTRSARLRITGDDGSQTASLSGVGANSPGVSFRWREALRPHGKALVAGLAACKSSSSCRLRARGVLSGVAKRGAAVRHMKVKLPAVQLTIGAGKTRSLRVRLPGLARLAAKGGGRLQLKLDWSADGQHGHSRSDRGLSA
jgi:HYDIN/CFA65/VesB-like, Ig-like domain